MTDLLISENASKLFSYVNEDELKLTKNYTTRTAHLTCPIGLRLKESDSTFTHPIGWLDYILYYFQILL